MPKNTNDFTTVPSLADADTLTGVQGGALDVQIPVAALRSMLQVIQDAGNYFTTNTVEAALQQLGATTAGAPGAYQAKDSDLTAIAALTTTPFGRSLLTAADAAATRALISAQTKDADLDAIAALTTTTFGRNLLTLVNAEALAALTLSSTNTAEGVSESALSLGFLRFMQSPLRHFVGFADVKMLEYAPDYIGPVRGEFTVHRPVVTDPTPVEVGAPTGVIPHLYRGLIYGAITGWVTGDEVRVFKNGVAVPTCTVTPTDAFFGVDLAPAPPDLPVGPWTLQQFRAGAAVGLPWPQVPHFTNTKVELHVITDTDYKIAEAPADTSGTFFFPACEPGDKRVALVANGNELLGEACPVPALLRSYITVGFPGADTRFETTSYVYDHAVGLCAVLAMGDSQFADHLFRGLLKHRDSNGRFRFVRQQEGTAQGDLFMRTGAHAWAVYAWLKYLAARPEKVETHRTAVTASISYMMSLLSSTGPTAGLIKGGTGQYTPDGSGGQIFDEAYVIPWASTEHNIDAYFVLKLAQKVLGGGYGAQATTLANNMKTLLWTGTRLRQGVKDTGDDDAYALDCHTWGSLFLLSAGFVTEAQQNFSDAARFRFTVNGVTGYNVSYDHAGYPGMKPNVWAEGTFGWIYAARALGVPYKDVLRSMLGVQRDDGTWPYVQVEDAPYELYPYPSSIAAAWAIPAIVGRGIWDD